jgi:uncharacterized protein
MSEHHEHTHERRHGLMLAVGLLFLALGVAVGGYFVGNMMYKMKVATNIATVRGLAEREVKADVASWSVNFEASDATLATAYEAANASKEKVITFLKDAGFADADVTPNALTVYKREDREANGRLLATTYQISGSVIVRSADVDKVAASIQKVGDLVGQGVLISSSYPQYFYTKLNDIKPEMLGEATRNARTAAEQFAKDANAKVGNINNAVQGAFTLSPRDAGENQGDEASSMFKKVRVVTTISFYLER